MISLFTSDSKILKTCQTVNSLVEKASFDVFLDPYEVASHGFAFTFVIVRFQSQALRSQSPISQIRNRFSPLSPILFFF